MDPKDEEYQIELKFENQVDGSYLNLNLVDELFTKNSLEFDKKNGADKIADQLGKVILRIAWHLKEHWEGTV